MTVRTRKVCLGEHNEGLVDAQVKAKWVMREDMDGSHWFVRVEPEPTTLIERFVAWMVRNLTPHWDVIQSVRKIQLPITAEEAGALFGASIAEKREKAGQVPRDVMVLQIAEEHPND